MGSYHFSVGDEAGIRCPEARSSSAEAGHEGKGEARLLNQLGREGVVAARPLHNNVINIYICAVLGYSLCAWLLTYTLHVPCLVQIVRLGSKDAARCALDWASRHRNLQVVL